MLQEPGYMMFERLLKNFTMSDLYKLEEMLNKEIEQRKSQTTLTAEELQMAGLQSQRILCIRAIRDRLDIGLKEAKDLVDAAVPFKDAK